MTNRKSVTDIDIRSNTFKNLANGIFIIGHTDGAGAPAIQLETARRIRIHNNLFQSIDGGRGNSSDTSYFPTGFGGYPLYTSLGMEDLHFTHNTVCGAGGGCNPSTGLIYENNIVSYGTGGGLGSTVGAIATGAFFGLAALDKVWQSGEDSGWLYRKNIIMLRGNLPTQAPLGPYPTGNLAHNLNSGDLPFVNASAGNYRLRALYRALDNCYGRAGDCTTTGRDAGVDFAELLRAQGATSQARLQRVGSRQLGIQASTYLGGYCAAEASADSFVTKTSATVLGEGRSRTMWVDALLPNTIYQYRARCGNGPVLTGVAQTRATGVDRRFDLRLKPPAWMTITGAVRAVIRTGLSPSTLSESSNLLCTTGCTHIMPVVDGTLLYYKVDYRNAGDVTVASSPLRAWAP